MLFTSSKQATIFYYIPFTIFPYPFSYILLTILTSLLLKKKNSPDLLYIFIPYGIDIRTITHNMEKINDTLTNIYLRFKLNTAKKLSFFFQIRFSLAKYYVKWIKSKDILELNVSTKENCDTIQHTGVYFYSRDTTYLEGYPKAITIMCCANIIRFAYDFNLIFY